MSANSEGADEGPYPAFSMRPYLLSIALLMISILTGCTKYQKYSPTPVGTYYPTLCATPVLGREATFLMQPTTVTLCPPYTYRISEVGMIQYNSLDDNSKAEVARLEFSNGGVYVMTDKLKAWGRIEYSGHETWGMKISKLWSGFWSAIGGIIMIFFACVVIFFVMVFLLAFNK